MDSLTLIKRELYEIGKTYPSFMGLLNRPVLDEKCKLGHRWAELLKDLDFDDLSNYCFEIANCDRPIVPDGGDMNDRFVYFARKHCKRLATEREKKREQHERSVQFQKDRENRWRPGEDDASQAVAKHWKKAN